MLDGPSTQIPNPGLESFYPLRTWMELTMHSLQPLLIDVGIHLGGRNIRMAQHFLDDAQIRAVAEQMCCEAVPQQVRIHILFQARSLRVLLNDLPESRRR